MAQLPAFMLERHQRRWPAFQLNRAGGVFNGGLILNGGFEDGRTNWPALGFGLGDQDIAVEGDALVFTGSPSGSRGVATSVFAQALQPDTTYDLSFRLVFRAGSAVTSNLRVQTTGDVVIQVDETTVATGPLPSTEIVTASFTTTSAPSPSVTLLFRTVAINVAYDLVLDDIRLVAPAVPEESGLLTPVSAYRLWAPGHSIIQDGQGNEVIGFVGRTANSVSETLFANGVFGQVFNRNDLSDAATHLGAGIPPVSAWGWPGDVTGVYASQDQASWDAAAWDGMTLIPDNFDSYLNQTAADWAASAGSYIDLVEIAHPGLDILFVTGMPEMTQATGSDPLVVDVPGFAAFRAVAEGAWQTWNDAVHAAIAAAYPSNRVLYIDFNRLFWHLYDTTDFGLLVPEVIWRDPDPHGHANNTWYYLKGIALYAYLFGKRPPLAAGANIPAQIHATVVADYDDIVNAIWDWIVAQTGPVPDDGFTVSGGESEMVVTAMLAVSEPTAAGGEAQIVISA